MTELTLEEVNGFISGYVKTTKPGRILSAIFEAARAHLSQLEDKEWTDEDEKRAKEAYDRSRGEPSYSGDAVSALIDMTDEERDEAALRWLDRPVLGDEQMREALELSKHVIGMFSGEPIPKSNNNYWLNRAVRLSRALLAMSEQLAAEQEKVKALQPKADAYDEGQTVFGSMKEGNVILDHGEDVHPDNTVRVCKPVDVKGDG